MKQKKHIFRGGFILVLVIVFSAIAQNPKAEKSELSDNTVKQTEDGVEILDAVKIYGSIEKPQTVFIIPGKDPQVEDVEIKRSFLKEIYRKVEKPVLKSQEIRLKDEAYIPF